MGIANGATRAEIDHILTNRRWCLLDVSVVPSFCSGSDHRLLRAKIRLSHTMEKNICYRQRRRKEVVYDDCVLEDSLSQEDYEPERASKSRTTNLDRISKTTKELLGRRRALRLDPNASHIERPIIPTGEAPPRILPSEVRVAIKSMKPGTAPGPDFISADFLRAGGHPLHVKERIPDQWKTSRTVLIHKKGVRQGDTISPKLFTAALQWIMKSLSWEERGIRVDGRFLSNLRFADDIVLFPTNEAETMLNELNEAGKRIGLRINRKKTQFMKNAYCEDGGVQLEGSQIVETPSYVYLGRSMNMENTEGRTE
ncbi:hypothetical protein RB195_026503 [Necator americanus]|uniref:Reverse transcriptase domain-containing protein n=2 Tax=Necator americanus TaxID=51031 RepID=A0ABR1EWR3_NECAM